jgi:hypothetical protein
MADIKIEDLPDLVDGALSNDDFIIIQQADGGTYKAPVSAITRQASQQTQYNVTNQTLPINRTDLLNINSTALIEVKIVLTKRHSSNNVSPLEHDFFIYKPQSLDYILVAGGPGYQAITRTAGQSKTNYQVDYLSKYDFSSVQKIGSAFDMDVAIYRTYSRGSKAVVGSTNYPTINARITTTPDSLSVTVTDTGSKYVTAVDFSADIHANIIAG